MPHAAWLAKSQFQIADYERRIDNSPMPLRVLVVPDKFKGTLSAASAAESIAQGWRKARPKDTVELLPMSDGGDGFGPVLSELLGAEPQKLQTVDAAHRRRDATWWWDSKTKTAIVESANVIGLALLPPGRFHPFELDTFGLGEVLLAAQAKGAKELLVGIGGSATNDGGFGLAKALGWEFHDENGRLIERWTQLDELSEIRGSSLQIAKLVVAVDVQNKLLGARGATRVYGLQKGLRGGDLTRAECCLRRLARVMKRHSGNDLARAPGAGAAGGLGFGLAAFLGARLRPGFELFARHAKLSERLRSADLVVTGEGAIDSSTAMGKGVGQIARRCRALGIPCVGLAGTAVNSQEVNRLFAGVHALTDLTTSTEARAKPALWLERLASQAARTLL
jgi:glycerate kinase